MKLIHSSQQHGWWPERVYQEGNQVWLFQWIRYEDAVLWYRTHQVTPRLPVIADRPYPLEVHDNLIAHGSICPGRLFWNRVQQQPELALMEVLLQ